MRVTVAGASGQVGEHLVTAFRARGVEVSGTTHEQPIEGLRRLDVRDRADVDAMMDELAPEVVVAPAAMPNVDLCQREPEQTAAINVLGTANLAAACAERGARLVWFSTDYLFDGTAGPYPEDTPAHPIQEYGWQKLRGEHIILATLADALVVRTNVVFGWERRGKNFVQRLVTTLEAGGSMRAPGDQLGTPTYAPNLAAIVAELVEREVTGVVNVSGPDLVDRHAFARAAAETFGLDPEAIARVTTPELGQDAPRPLRAGLTVDRVRRLVETQPLPFLEGLRMMAEDRPVALR